MKENWKLIISSFILGCTSVILFFSFVILCVELTEEVIIVLGFIVLSMFPSFAWYDYLYNKFKK